MEYEKTSTITIKQRDGHPFTLESKHHESGYKIVKLKGPVDMSLDLIILDPATKYADGWSDTGLSFEYRKSSKYDSQMATHVVIPRSEEERVIEWLEENIGDNRLLTDKDNQYWNNVFKHTHHRTTCAECGEYSEKMAVTVHRGTEPDLRFCSQYCHDDWSFDRAIDNLKRKSNE